jgi:hypothetical protein
MSHFAKIINGFITEIIEATIEQINSGEFGDPAQFVITNGNGDRRKPYVGSVGYTYDVEHDAFVPPKTYPTWVYDYELGSWKPPVPFPEEAKPWLWSEATQSWVDTSV